MDTLEEKINQNERKLNEFNNNQNDMNKSYIQLIQLKNVLEKVNEYMAESNFKGTGLSENKVEVGGDEKLLDHNPTDSNFR